MSQASGGDMSMIRAHLMQELEESLGTGTRQFASNLSRDDIRALCGMYSALYAVLFPFHFT